MAETKQPLLISLGRGFNGFYCPETRFHLIGVVKPQGIYPAETLSEDVKRGLRSGSLIDVNKVLTEDDVKPGTTFVAHVTSGERKKEIAIQVEEQLKADEGKDKTEDEKLAEETGELLSETDVMTNSGKVLIAYIEKTDGISLESLGLTGGSKVADIREALNKHFGYGEKPVDKEAAAKDAE